MRSRMSIFHRGLTDTQGGEILTCGTEYCRYTKCVLLIKTYRKPSKDSLCTRSKVYICSKSLLSPNSMQTCPLGIWEGKHLCIGLKPIGILRDKH